jgi:exodeoxyribonuclease VII small subunit
VIVNDLARAVFHLTHFRTAPRFCRMAADEGFDQVLERLKGLVDKLEQGSLGLEEALRLFEEGVALARRGHSILDAAEKRVELLVRGPGGEGDSVVPFRGGGENP